MEAKNVTFKTIIELRKQMTYFEIAKRLNTSFPTVWGWYKVHRQPSNAYCQLIVKEFEKELKLIK